MAKVTKIKVAEPEMIKPDVSELKTLLAAMRGLIGERITVADQQALVNKLEGIIQKLES